MFRGGGTHDFYEFIQTGRRKHAAHSGRVYLRMDVVD